MFIFMRCLLKNTLYKGFIVWKIAKIYNPPPLPLYSARKSTLSIIIPRCSGGGCMCARLCLSEIVPVFLSVNGYVIGHNFLL